MLKVMLLSSFVLLMAVNSFAYTVDVTYDNSMPWNTTALTGYATDGGMMDGMVVTATFTGGSTQSASWTHTGTSGSAVSSGFSLTQTGGTTYSNPWLLSSNGSLSSLQIDAGAGNTVFDAIYPIPDDPAFWGSPGSAQGWFEVTGATGYSHVDAIFSGPVKVEDVFYNDLYRYLTFNFVVDNALVSAQYGLSFIADTDNLSISGDITPDNPVPEPSTMLLLGAGLAGFAFWRRKKTV
ncbi:MAG: PEP-CTERM sorting domain-containing protein [Desulfuromonadaceae bacterium]|nr:PEP-CTERM sorting domain-containing protein [Desulfuromonadaceae bacterium]MDD5104702.1 PEP-CTERM sorting domain-containing protein [Desulfuromonadaceae bacterium]